MTIECRCPGCGGRFRAADEAAGRRVACPKCRAVIQLPGPAKSAPVHTTPAAPKQSSPPQNSTTGQTAWFVRTADDKQHGPMAKGQLDQLVAQGRLDAFCEVRRADWEAWRDIEEIYPTLAMDDGKNEYVAAEAVDSSSDGPTSRIRPCPDCGQTVSRRAVQCPHCGCPLVEAEKTRPSGRPPSMPAHRNDSEDPATRARRRRTRRIVFLVATISLLVALVVSGVYVAIQIQRRVAAAKKILSPVAPAPPVAPSAPPSTQTNTPLTAEQVAKCKEKVAEAMAREVDEALRARHDALSAIPQLAEYARALEIAQEMADPLSNRREKEKKDDSKINSDANGPYQSQYEELLKECRKYLNKHVTEPVENEEAIWNVGRDWFKMRLPEQKVLEELLRPGTTPTESH